MRWFGITLILFSRLALGQDVEEAKLVDCRTEQPIPRAHIINLTQQKVTTSNDGGMFHLPMLAGDTIQITCIGYKPLEVTVDSLGANHVLRIFHMCSDTTVLETLVFNALPSEGVFKQKILDYQPEEDPSYFGIPQVEMGHSSLLEETHVKSLGFAVTHPLGFLYHNLSKKEKEKRSMHKLTSNKHRNVRNQQKYNRVYVADLTKLEGERLTHFMAFCDFSDEFLDRSTQYQIAEAIMDKLIEFQNRGKG